MRPLMLAVSALLLSAPLPVLAQSEDDIIALETRLMFARGDYATMVPKLEELAARGHPRAQAILGYLYEKGLGLPKDEVRGYELTLAAAEQGYATALHNVGSYHQDGLAGLGVDEAKARDWYWKAVAQDYPPSLTALALMLRDGEGGPADPVTALALLERAVALGDPDGTAELAYMLATGDGVEQDQERARRLYEVAAAQRIDWAERDYGEMLELGEGGPVDLIQAEAFYRRSAAQGYAMAGMDIAEMIWADTSASPERQVEALAWCFWAEAKPPMWDGTDYDGACADPEATLAPDDVAKARVLAETF